MKTLDGPPTIDEALQAQQETGLPESYWWVKGWDFNRPLMAKVNISSHITEGNRVRVEMGDHRPVGGYLASDLQSVALVFTGPIQLPDGWSPNSET